MKPALTVLRLAARKREVAIGLGLVVWGAVSGAVVIAIVRRWNPETLLACVGILAVYAALLAIGVWASPKGER